MDKERFSKKKKLKKWVLGTQKRLSKIENSEGVFPTLILMQLAKEKLTRVDQKETLLLSYILIRL